MWHTNGDNKSSFAIGILRAWKNLQHGLKLKPLIEIEEYERQPILWNLRFKTEHGHMLASRSRLAWGKMEYQVASSVQAWKAFAALSNHQQRSVVSDIRGGCIM
jgi:hypothetical protein